MTARNFSTNDQLDAMTSKDLTAAYRTVFGKLPPKGQASKSAMIAALVNRPMNARIYDVPAAPASDTRSVDQLLADLAAATTKGAKKAIRAALRRRNFFLSRQAKNDD